MPVQSSADPPRAGFLAVRGLLQDRVASSRHSGKTGNSCLLEDLALGSRFPSFRDVVVSVRVSGHSMPSFFAALLQTSCRSVAVWFGELQRLVSSVTEGFAADGMA
ncbi:hypothetical protein XENOCAPTIV_007105 [Xenoophorus captivus]|uniref:Uncharacterized protein n=1 Tax=Xenoophorus captivus TaxID=1517983 RepID=A0ABV0S901_9TELE